MQPPVAANWIAVMMYESPCCMLHQVLFFHAEVIFMHLFIALLFHTSTSTTLLSFSLTLSCTMATEPSPFASSCCSPDEVG
jgi:hypothetical protein